MGKSVPSGQPTLNDLSSQQQANGKSLPEQSKSMNPMNCFLLPQQPPARNAELEKVTKSYAQFYNHSDNFLKLIKELDNEENQPNDSAIMEQLLYGASGLNSNGHIEPQDLMKRVEDLKGEQARYLVNKSQNNRTKMQALQESNDSLGESPDDNTSDKKDSPKSDEEQHPHAAVTTPPTLLEQPVVAAVAALGAASAALAGAYYSFRGLS